MIGVIGLGQAGGNVANIFAERGIQTAAINYSSKDLETCNHIENKLKLIGSEGVGKQREEAIRLFHNNYESALIFIKEHFSQPSVELIFIVFSAAGGSGSGIASILSELLLNEMQEKTFIICPIIPTVSECITAQLNTLDTLTSLSELEACIIPLDNEKGMFNGAKDKSYHFINQTFVDTILTIADYTNMHSITGNFDARDLCTLLSTTGFCSIGQCDISHLKNEDISVNIEAVSKKVRTSHFESIFTSPSLEQIVRSGLIFDGQESLMYCVDVDKIHNQFPNQPLDVFEGYYTEEKGRVISIYCGLKFNSTRLNQIEKLATERIESFQNTHQSTSISIKRPTIKSPVMSSKPKKSLSDILNKHKKTNI